MSKKKCMVFETMGKVSDMQIKKDGDGGVRLHGIFGVCGVKNQNNRIYDINNYRQMVESLQKTIMTDGCPGELEHPNSMNINLANVSHKIESIDIDENGTVTGTILLLNTPKGKIAQAIVEGGLPLFISSRGAGTITNEGRVTLSNIKTYDLVGTPGFSQAKLTLAENQTLECLNESLDESGNSTWVIIDESEDEDKKDDSKEEKEEDSKEEKEEDSKEEKEDDSEEKSDDDKDSDDEDDKEENNKKDDTNIMKDLKDAIDKLSDKVTSLEAELHIAKESLESNKVNYDAIENWITEEFAPEFRENLNEEFNAVLEQHTENLANSVQSWVTEEFAPEVQNWVVEEFAPEVQNWVVEEFAPEVQNWVCEEFAPEVQNWVVEEFAPEVQNWIVEEYSPVVENWITEEYSPVVQNWVTEEFAPEVKNEINENVSAFMENRNETRLSEIDSLLESIDSTSAVEQIVKEEAADNKFKGMYVVEHMPAQYKASWNMLSEERQNDILRSSKMYDFTRNGVLESFWAAVDFTEDTNKQEVNAPVNVVEAYHNNIAQQMRRFGKWA